jgi:hypothetical protein
MSVRRLIAAGLGPRIAACVAAVALAGFLLVALTGLAAQRSEALTAFDNATASVTGLLADNMAGSVRFGRPAAA